jgi:aspartyl-tRNA(Asn)/glutamyl-tRNA(Gln) amidotransferase subunit B
MAGVSDDEIAALCREAVEANPKAVATFLSGKDKAINVLFGYLMKKTAGKADTKKAEAIIRELIGRTEKETETKRAFRR